MNKLINASPGDSSEDIARFIFDKGKNVHQRIDRIVREIMINKNVSVKNLTIAQADTMMAIHQVGDISITELSKLLGVSSPSVSTMVDRMVEKKLLVRTQDTKDRRRVTISLSSETKQQIRLVEESVLKMFKNLIKAVGEDIGELWCKVLLAVESALDEHPDIATPHIEQNGD